MGTVNRAGRLALVSILAGAALAACGSPAPTSSFQTKQVVALGGYGWGAPAMALSASVAAAVSEIQPVTTNIVGTSPWLGFPSPAAAAAGLASPWPTFAGNIGTAAMLNGQMGYILGLGPLGVPLAATSLVGLNTLGLASPVGILGYAGLPFIGPGTGAPYGVGAAGVAGMAQAIPQILPQQAMIQQPMQQEMVQQQPVQQEMVQQQPVQQAPQQPVQQAPQQQTSQTMGMGN